MGALKGIDRLPSGTYRVRVARRGKTYTRHARTRREAEQVHARLVTALEDGNYVDPRSGLIPLSEFFCSQRADGSELGWLPSRQLRASSERAYRALWRLHVDPLLGSVPLSWVTPLELENLRSAWRSAGLGAQTQAAVWRLLVAVLNGAVKAGRIVSNPATSLARPRTEDREQRHLEADELLLLAETIDERFKALVLLGGIGGLRIGELAGLELRHVDTNRRRIRIDQQATEVGGVVTVGPPKSRASRRTVPIGEGLATELNLHRDRFRSSASLRDPFFSMPAGGRLVPSAFRRRYFHPAAEAAGLEPLRIHDLRHTAAAIAIHAGLHPKAIQTRLGHGSIRTTLDIYGHLMPESLDVDAEALEQGIHEAERRREETA